jgi:cytochrome c-type biogenesis protein CcsB
MTPETAAFWLAVLLYTLATIFSVVGLVFSVERLAKIGFLLVVGGFVAHTASIVMRWVSTGRLPYVQDYENALSGTWAIVVLYLVISFIAPRVRVSGIVVLPCVLLTIGYGLLVPSDPGPVTPAYRSLWLVVHVIFAWATYSAYVAAASLATLELLKTGRRKLIKPDSALGRTPEPERLAEMTFRLVVVGFIVNGAAMASGAIWAYELWGSYWRWDPVETWTLLTWLAYAFYLHAHITLGWRGRRLAWVVVFALFGVMMTFWGVQLAPTTYHLFRNIGTGMFDTGRGR